MTRFFPDLERETGLPSFAEEGGFEFPLSHRDDTLFKRYVTLRVPAVYGGNIYQGFGNLFEQAQGQINEVFHQITNWYKDAEGAWSWAKNTFLSLCPDVIKAVLAEFGVESPDPAKDAFFKATDQAILERRAAHLFFYRTPPECLKEPGLLEQVDQANYYIPTGLSNSKLALYERIYAWTSSHGEEAYFNSVGRAEDQLGVARTMRRLIPIAAPGTGIPTVYPSESAMWNYSDPLAYEIDYGLMCIAALYQAEMDFSYANDLYIQSRLAAIQAVQTIASVGISHALAAGAKLPLGEAFYKSALKAAAEEIFLEPVAAAFTGMLGVPPYFSEFVFGELLGDMDTIRRLKGGTQQAGLDLAAMAQLMAPIMEQAALNLRPSVTVSQANELILLGDSAVSEALATKNLIDGMALAHGFHPLSTLSRHQTSVQICKGVYKSVDGNLALQFEAFKHVLQTSQFMDFQSLQPALEERRSILAYYLAKGQAEGKTLPAILADPDLKELLGMPPENSLYLLLRLESGMIVEISEKGVILSVKQWNAAATAGDLDFVNPWSLLRAEVVNIEVHDPAPSPTPRQTFNARSPFAFPLASTAPFFFHEILDRHAELKSSFMRDIIFTACIMFSQTLNPLELSILERSLKKMVISIELIEIYAEIVYNPTWKFDDFFGAPPLSKEDFKQALLGANQNPNQPMLGLLAQIMCDFNSRMYVSDLNQLFEIFKSRAYDNLHLFVPYIDNIEYIFLKPTHYFTDVCYPISIVIQPQVRNLLDQILRTNTYFTRLIQNHPVYTHHNLGIIRFHRSPIGFFKSDIISNIGGNFEADGILAMCRFYDHISSFSIDPNGKFGSLFNQIYISLGSGFSGYNSRAPEYAENFHQLCQNDPTIHYLHSYIRLDASTQIIRHHPISGNIALEGLLNIEFLDYINNAQFTAINKQTNQKETLDYLKYKDSVARVLQNIANVPQIYIAKDGVKGFFGDYTGSNYESDLRAYSTYRSSECSFIGKYAPLLSNVMWNILGYYLQSQYVVRAKDGTVGPVSTLSLKQAIEGMHTSDAFQRYIAAFFTQLDANTGTQTGQASLLSRMQQMGWASPAAVISEIQRAFGFNTLFENPQDYEWQTNDEHIAGDRGHFVANTDQWWAKLEGSTSLFLNKYLLYTNYNKYIFENLILRSNDLVLVNGRYVDLHSVYTDLFWAYLIDYPH